MSRLKAMLRTHPAPAGDNGDAAIECIEACFDCAEVCSICADACLAEKKGGELVQCIRLNQDCADICRVTGTLLARTGQRAGIWSPGAALAAAELGLLDEARASFDAVAADRFSSVPRDYVWPAALGFDVAADAPHLYDLDADVQQFGRGCMYLVYEGNEHLGELARRALHQVVHANGSAVRERERQVGRRHQHYRFL